jgi:hypothetical protein
MAKKEKRHTHHSRHLASAMLLLAFTLQGFLPTAKAVSASEPLTEIPTQFSTNKSQFRQQEQIRELQRQQQMNFLQDQQRKLQIQRLR